MTLCQTDFKKLIWLSVFVAPLIASMLVGCSSGGSDASGTGNFTGLIQESGILISSTDTIPTKRIVEFQNLVMVSHSSPNTQPVVMQSMSVFVAKVRDSGANAVINFNISLVPHAGRRTTLLHGMAVVVE